MSPHEGNDDVRVFVDISRASEAIVREWDPIPTIKELLHNLNGSIMFSKIDLKWGFHQILLSKQSRHYFCHTPRAVSVQAVDVWSNIGTNTSRSSETC